MTRRLTIGMFTDSYKPEMGHDGGPIVTVTLMITTMARTTEGFIRRATRAPR